MAPAGPGTRPDKERRVNALLSFSSDLRARLSASPLGETKTLEQDLQKQIAAFPANLSSVPSLRFQDIDNEGTELWNLCTRLRRGHDAETPRFPHMTIFMARVFAFMLLDYAQGKGNLANLIRVMKVGLKTAKSCIELKRLDFALKVLEKVAGYEELIKKPGVQISPEDIQVQSRLSSEYFVVRTTLAWRQEQLDVAEYMFNKASLSQRQLDPDTAESLADLLYEMGRELLDKKDYELSSKWLGRAYQVLVGQELEMLSSDVSELRLSIIQSRVKALLFLGQIDASQEAQSLVDLLENDIGDKLIVLLLRLELIWSSTNENFDRDTYGDVIQKMIRTVDLTEGNFRLIMHHIRKLNDKAPSMACNILDSFLKMRLFEVGNESWIETALINRIWLTTTLRDGLDTRASIENILTIIASNITKSLSASAMHAAQTLLWKRIESNHTSGQYEAAESWCRLAMHKIFEYTGDLNKAKIGRKLMICSLSRQDMSGAREMFENIPNVAKDDPLTRFLMFKVAIRSQESELATECLEKVYQASSQDGTLLYACVLDAQQAGNKLLAIAALQKVLQKYKYNTPPSIHLPALLRCTIRLVLSQIEGSDANITSDIQSAIDMLCTLFGAASSHAHRSYKQKAEGEALFIPDELDWFSKNAYNIALKYAAVWDSQDILRIVGSCIKFIDLYPDDIGQTMATDISLRRIFCDFLASVLLISITRPEDNVEVQLQNYLQIRRHVESYDKRLQELGELGDGAAQDLLKKLSILLAYDFEAAVKLKAWDDLAEVILKAVVCGTMKVYELMADCLLSADAPAHVIILNLKRIVNEAWDLDNMDINKLSRYMRCLLRYACPEGGTIAEGLLDQVRDLAYNAQETENPYPTEELEWVATTSFNRAIDFYCASDDDACKNWAGKAIAIASFCPDDGALQNLLQEKLLGLNWGDAET